MTHTFQKVGAASNSGYQFYHVFFWLVASQPHRFLWPSTDGYRGAKVASSMRHAEEKQKSAAAVQARIAL